MASSTNTPFNPFLVGAEAGQKESLLFSFKDSCTGKDVTWNRRVLLTAAEHLDQLPLYLTATGQQVEEMASFTQDKAYPVHAIDVSGYCERVRFHLYQDDDFLVSLDFYRHQPTGLTESGFIVEYEDLCQRVAAFQKEQQQAQEQRLYDALTIFESPISIKEGDVVIWRQGMGTRRAPSAAWTLGEHQMAIVHHIGTNNPCLRKLNDSPMRWIEPYDVILALLDADGNMQFIPSHSYRLQVLDMNDPSLDWATAPYYFYHRV